MLLNTLYLLARIVLMPIKFVILLDFIDFLLYY
jgi:hypothetical protein